MAAEGSKSLSSGSQVCSSKIMYAFGYLSCMVPDAAVLNLSCLVKAVRYCKLKNILHHRCPYLLVYNLN